MTIELTPLGVACNLSCTYCYQEPMRESGNRTPPYDMAAMKAALEREGDAFTVFGGEPLLMPIEDLEEVFAFGFEKWGKNGIQTAGNLITDEHVELFIKYKVHVGISVDGPDDLNDARWAGSPEKTRDATAATDEAIRELCRRGHPPSLIVTLYRTNAGDEEKIERMVAWLKDLAGCGVRHARLHQLEVDTNAAEQDLAMSHEENFRAIIAISEAVPEVSFDALKDVRAGLLGDFACLTCTWKQCDPYTTGAVQGVNGQGVRSNCGRTNKDGVNWVKADRVGFERQLALYHTPQDLGGCQDCRFFLMCRGQCPGTAIDGDWRNKSRDCELWIMLFEHVEKRLLDEGTVPVSLRETQRAEMEAEALRQLAAGRSGSHGDHTDRRHGDHTDRALLRVEVKS